MPEQICISQLREDAKNAAKACVEPAFLYFEKKLSENGCMKQQLAYFKAARYLNCGKIHDIVGGAGPTLDEFKAFPGWRDADIAELTTEFPIYLAKSNGLLPENVDVFKFWVENGADLPAWRRAAMHAALVQPSSAAAERIFSILRARLTKRQNNMMQDSVEASVMLRYNGLQRRKRGCDTTNDCRALPPAYPRPEDDDADD